MTTPAIQFTPATRCGVIPLVGVYGKSGSGKTVSALRLALGLAGSKRVGLVDTENGRSRIALDLTDETGALMFPGGFDSVDLQPPFTPDRYVECIALAETLDLGALVIDSMTHEWSGEGGVLEWQETELQRMAGEDWKKREACKMAAWIAPKKAHKRMVARILRSRIPIVCCLRAEEKTHMDKNPGEKTRVVTDDFTTPDFDRRFIFEMLANLETVADPRPGCCRVTKYSHPAVLAALPAIGQLITPEHGANLRRFCFNELMSPLPSVDRPDKPDSSEMKSAKAKLWRITEAFHHGDAQLLQQWLIDELFMPDDLTLAAITLPQLRAVISKVENKLSR